jgi:hypothetical protein
MDRSRMTARVVPLTSAEAGDPRFDGSVDERVAAVEMLTMEAWRLAGRSLPVYTRASMPIVVASLQDHAGST